MGLLVDEFGVEIEIKAKDEASPAADTISRSFERAKTAIEKTKDKVKDFGKECVTGALAAIGLSFGLREMFNKGLEANLAFVKVKDSLTGVLYAQQGWKKGLTSIQQYNYAVGQAKDVVEELGKSEDDLAMPLEELAGTYRAVSGVAFSQLGMNKQQVMELTNTAAAAGKVLGMGGQAAASTLMRTIQFGRVSARAVDPLSVKLREAIGTTKKLGSPELYRRVIKGLGDIVPVAKKMSDGFEGSMFRMKDAMDHLYRDLSKPTFLYLTGEIDKLRKWLDQTAVNGKKNIEVWADRLLWIVQKIEKVSKFIFDHWKAILALWLGNKALGIFKDFAGQSAFSMIGGKLGLGGGKGEAGESLTTSTVGTMNVGKMNVGSQSTGGLPTGAGSVAGTIGKTLWEWKAPILATLKAAVTGTVGAVALGTAAVVAGGAGGFAYGQRKRMEADASNTGMGEAWGNTSYMLQQHKTLLNPMSTQGGASSEGLHRATLAGKVAGGILGVGTLPREEIEGRMIGMFEGMERDQVRQRGIQLGITEAELNRIQWTKDVNKLIAKRWFDVIQDFQTNQQNAMMSIAKPPEDPNVKKKPAPPVINGGIHITQDFKDADPDRVFVRFKNDIENAWEFATQGAYTPGGTL